MADTKHPTAAVKAFKVEPGPKRADGAQIWYVEQPTGAPATIVTSGTSVAAIDRAATTYEDALKRLAKR